MSETRLKILECACDLYLDEGLQGFSMRKLARSVGVTAPALYRHYDSKERVLVAVLGEAYKLFAQYLYRALSAPTPLERLRTASGEYLNFALENPRQYEMMFVSAAGLGLDELPPEVEQHGCTIGQFWHDRVRECMDAGLLNPDDPERVSLTMWSHAHGLMVLYLRGMLQMEESEFRAFFAESSRRMAMGVGTERLEEMAAEVAGLGTAAG
jgi:AcrR family transcriptional regulator